MIILHVGPGGLAILIRCLMLAHTATQKGEEHMCAITQYKDLAANIQREHEQGEESCTDLENNVRVAEVAAKGNVGEHVGVQGSAAGKKAVYKSSKSQQTANTTSIAHQASQASVRFPGREGGEGGMKIVITKPPFI